MGSGSEIQRPPNLGECPSWNSNGEHTSTTPASNVGRSLQICRGNPWVLCSIETGEGRMDFTKIPTIESLGNLKGKRVFVRADFNVPMEGSTITSDARITAALPTIKLLM